MDIVPGGAYLPQIRELIEEYTRWIGRDLSFQGLNDELEHLDVKYLPPNGGLFAAVDENGRVCGCCAWRKLTDERCEMKRLYVSPSFRGLGLGERLALTVIAGARAVGYAEMVLDTLSAQMGSAIALYEKLGFSVIQPYYDNPLPDAVYMRLSLRGEQSMKIAVENGLPYLPQIRELIIEYSRSIGSCVCFQSLNDELEHLGERYSPPNGGLFAAIDSNGRVCGCAAWRSLTHERSEMKRLYVRPDVRGMGVGERLARAVIGSAQRAGYADIVLDTLATQMSSAIALYKKIGFEEIPPYSENLLPDAVYMRLSLNGSKGGTHMKIIENSCAEFVRLLATKAPVPGGGGASALCGAIGTALGNMVGSLTVGKKRYAAVEPEIKAMQAKCDALQAELLALVEKDAEAFAPLAAAYGLPKDTPEQAAEKDRVMEAALKAACEVPLAIMQRCCEAVELMEGFAAKGSKIAVSDAGVGAALCRAALEGASLNVFINTKAMKDRAAAAAFDAKANALLGEFIPRAQATFDAVSAQLRG